MKKYFKQTIIVSTIAILAMFMSTAMAEVSTKSQMETKSAFDEAIDSAYNAFKYESVGIRWANSLESSRDKYTVRLYSTFIVAKNHHLKFAWERSSLDTAADIFGFGDNDINDSGFVDYSYYFD